MDNRIPHYCHVKTCETKVPPRFLMCRRHWAARPPKLRSDVWRLYRPGQENDKNPTPEYLDAAGAACRAVETLERNRRREDMSPAEQARFDKRERQKKQRKMF